MMYSFTSLSSCGVLRYGTQLKLPMLICYNLLKLENLTIMPMKLRSIAFENPILHYGSHKSWDNFGEKI